MAQGFYAVSQQVLSEETQPPMRHKTRYGIAPVMPHAA
jgi:hypothetical protein